MLLSSELLQKTKRTNVSENPAITRQRVEELLRPAKLAQKKAIRELADVSTQVFHSIYSKGIISIKMVIAISKELDVNPFFLTGKVDEPGEFSEESLRDLLLKHGYRDLVALMELPERKKRPYTRRVKPDEPAPQTAMEEAPEEQLIDAVDILPTPAVPLEEESQQILLRALHVRVKAGIAGANEKLEKINQLLLG